MDYIDFKGARHYGKPPDWDDDKFGRCGTLPVRVEHSVTGLQMLRSYWRPTPQELETLKAGGAIELTIWGRIHPPISMLITHEVKGEIKS